MSNLIVNPSFTLGLTGWSPGSGANTASPIDFRTSPNCALFTVPVSGPPLI